MTAWDNILLCVDSSKNSERAVEYVAGLVARIETVRIRLLHVYPAPPPDYSIRGGSIEQYMKSRELRGLRLLNRASEILMEAGIVESRLAKIVCMAKNRSISQQVLEVRKQRGCGTVVTGKRGISKAEEFLFGSISNALARQSKDFTTWIVG